MLAQILANLILALMWTLLLTPFSIENFLVGWLVGLIVVYFWQRRGSGYFYPRKLWEIAFLLLIFLREVVKSCFLVMRFAFARGNKMRSGLITYETKLTTPLGLILLCNMITITPGSFVIEVSPDNKILLIHVFHFTDAETFKRDVRVCFEENIRKVLG